MIKYSIIIPTRNRKTVLFSTLNKLKGLRDNELEILVYDDNSNEDYSAELKTIFPSVKYYRSNLHLGLCELRNRLINESIGDFIIGLDDDSYFESEEDYLRAKQILDDFPNAAIVGFKIITKNGIQFINNIKDGIYNYNAFMGCGYIARKSCLSSVGGFDLGLIRQGDERDLVMKLMVKGFEVIYATEIKVFHEETTLERDHQFIHRHAFCNELLFYLKYFPVFIVPIFFIKSLISHAIFCARRFWFKAYFQGIFLCIKNLKRTILKRKSVSYKILYRYMRLSVPIAKRRLKYES